MAKEDILKVVEIKYEIDIIEMIRQIDLQIMKGKHQDSVVNLEERMTTRTRKTPMADEVQEEVVGLLAVRSSFRGLAFYL